MSFIISLNLSNLSLTVSTISDISRVSERFAMMPINPDIMSPVVFITVARPSIAV